jgi:hypothetical protein
MSAMGPLTQNDSWEGKEGRQRANSFLFKMDTRCSLSTNRVTPEIFHLFMVYYDAVSISNYSRAEW